MNPDTKEARQRSADELVRLANERSRLKHVLAMTWTALNIPKDIQEVLMDMAVEGNQMNELDVFINRYIVPK